MNVLLSSAGRQVFLVNEFKKVLKDIGQVYVTDVNPAAASLKVADKSFIAPAYTSKDYLSWIIDICKINEVSLLISLNVEELLILESHRSIFLSFGCFLMGGEVHLIDSTYDKLKLNTLCKTFEILTPEIYNENDISSFDFNIFPLIAKPRLGKGSRGNVLLSNKKEFMAFFENKNKQIEKMPYIYQEYIDGVEYGIDIVNNFEKSFSSALVREKISMKNGETFEVSTKSNIDWINIARKISAMVLHQGIVDVDIIVKGKKKYLLDVNHRFGGGYIFSHFAGANLPNTFVNWIIKKEINEEWLNPKPELHLIRNEFGTVELYNKNE